ncbi:hypothetical protein [Pinirhizobacter soli]|uniref:hypothetical protein n=1 Tax=Pinirhizobacter soli TaxID=2786953 RepID=UPI00202A5273|nr:hypothetical protein [Pinirhizobacter soli]
MDATNSNIPYREQPSTVDEFLKAHNYPGMDDRMARMEVNIAYIRRDVDELRVDFGKMWHTIQAESSKRQEQFTELRGEIGSLRHEMGDMRLAITAMDSRLDRKLEQHLLKLQSRMLWTIGATVGPIVLAWFIQTFLPALRASGG